MKNRNLFFIIIVLFVLIGSCFGVTQENWQRLVTGDISLYCQKIDLKQGELILEDVKAEVPLIIEDLALNIRGEIKIILTPDNQTFQELTGGMIPEWGVGAADKENRLIFLKSPRFSGTKQNIKQVLIHELTHILIGMQLNQKPLPRWFDEGLAMWTSRDVRIWDQIRFSRALLTGNEIPLSEIDYVLSFQKDKAALAYWQSHAAVDYLVTQFGKSTIQSLVDVKQDTIVWESWFKIITDMETWEFENLWIEAMKRKYRWSMIIDHRLLFSLLIVSLFVSAYFYKRSQSRRKLMMWEEDEKTLEEI